MKVSIVDYGLGNLHSVLKACDFVGMKAEITNDKNIIINSDAIILPGVGAYKSAMDNLKGLDLVSPLIDFSNSGKPLMGICLGMQLLLTKSDEFGETKGLGIFQGVCKKFPSLNKELKLKVPQINWNSIYPNNKDFKSNTPLEGLNKEQIMYFIHSYYADQINDDEVLSKTTYGGIEYSSSISRKNIFGFQFHPEKSGVNGLKIYEKFKEITYKTKINDN